MAPRVETARGFPSLEQIRANPFPQRIKGQSTKTARRVKADATVLAFDLSKSAIGWAVGSEGYLVNYGKIVLMSTREMTEILVDAAAYIRVLIAVYKPQRILVEQPLARHGATTAAHNQLLGMLRLTAAAQGIILTNKHLINPKKVKKALGVVLKQADHDQNKIKMVEYVNDRMGLALKFTKSKLDTDDDSADAIALLLADWDFPDGLPD